MSAENRIPFAEKKYMMLAEKIHDVSREAKYIPHVEKQNSAHKIAGTTALLKHTAWAIDHFVRLIDLTRLYKFGM